MSILNDRIKERRLACGLTLLDVSQQLNITEATMQRYEGGQIKNIKHETIVALADVFSCSPAYLMGWSDSPIDLTSKYDSLSSEEWEVIKKFRQSSDEIKNAVRRIVDIEHE